VREGKFHKFFVLGTLFAHKTSVVGWPESSDSVSINGDINTDIAFFAVFIYTGPSTKSLVLWRTELRIFLMLDSRN